MIVLIWNVRGVGSQGSPHRIRNLVRLYKPAFVCILEPFQDILQIQKWALNFGYPAENCEGNEKIWLFWPSDIKPEIISITAQVITFGLHLPDVNKTVSFSCVYASCDRNTREELWTTLKALADGEVGKENWAVLGDFNSILKPEEKKGGIAYNVVKSRSFQFFVSFFIIKAYPFDVHTVYFPTSQLN